jgi:phosphoserine phosphatase RsbU/P
VNASPEPPQLSPALRGALDEFDTLPEIVVLVDPEPEVLEAYALEERLSVIAVVSGEGEEGSLRRAEALDAGALEVIDPTMSDAEALARVNTAVARFRSRLRVEAARDELDRHSESLERDLLMAARLQRSFLPDLREDVPGFRFAAAYLPQEFVSGDTYDLRVVEVDEQGKPTHVALYTLDAVGHGVRAALLMVLLRAVFRPVDTDGRLRPPHDVVGELERCMRETRLDESPTAAFCYGVLDVERGRLAVANAGHPLPVILRAGGGVERVGTSGLLLGVVPEEYETTTVELRPGDRVFFFTDGADVEYDDGFIRQLEQHAGLDLSLEEHVGGALGATIELDAEGRPPDDVTVLALEVIPSQEETTDG